MTVVELHPGMDFVQGLLVIEFILYRFSIVA